MRVAFAAFSLIMLHVLLLLYSLRCNFVTPDEFGHLPAGVSHWDTHTFVMYRANPPLPRMVAVLPVMAVQPERDYQRPANVPGERYEWIVGADFLEMNKAGYLDLICLSRLAGVLWSVTAAVVVFLWARQLYGPTAGLLALLIWCFGPNVLAHAQLLMPDIPAATAALAATYTFWSYLRRPSFSLACTCGVLLGIAQLTKYTLLILYVVWPVLSILAMKVRGDNDIESKMGRVSLAHALAILFMSILVINAGYGFVETCRPLGELRFVSRILGGDPSEGHPVYFSGRFGNRFRESWLGSVPIPLPADYVLGIDVQRRDCEFGLPSYLAGKWQLHGWW